MSGRSTAEIVADLLNFDSPWARRAAADRLVELDAEATSLQTSLNETLAELFTPPSTAVLRGDVIYVNSAAALMASLTDVYKYLREQKRGLDASTIIEARNAIEIFDMIDALLPPCPTCGGKRIVRNLTTYEVVVHDPCPDCVDGKVSIERLVAVFNAVFDDDDRLPWPRFDFRKYLRAVRP